VASVRHNAIDVLRVATGEAHRRLERSLPIAADDADLDTYLHYVAGLYGWFKPVEDALWSRPWPAAVCAAERRGKADAIAADLRAAGRSVAGLALLADPPAVSTSQAWGIAYVIEGSQLGGAVLYRRLAGRCAPHALRYLRGYGDRTGALWKCFVQAMEEALPTPAQRAEAANGALQAFESLAGWLGALGLTLDAAREPACANRL
jgi:heme oxygenase